MPGREKYVPSPHHPITVQRQRERQYEQLWRGYADARRLLYAYEKPPWEKRKPYSVWEEMAEQLEPSNSSRVIDLGTNDGYFHRILRDKGFKGQFIGIDMEGMDLEAVRLIAKQKFPEADFDFIKGNAENLKGVIPDNAADRVVAAFVAYHMDKPLRLFTEAHRISQPDGKVIFSTRDVDNQLDTWMAARELAHSWGFAFPREIDRRSRTFIPDRPIEEITVYSHFGIEKMHNLLEMSQKFEVQYRWLQDQDLWIPSDELGKGIYMEVIESLLPYTVNIETGKEPADEDIDAMRPSIEEYVENLFENSGYQNKKVLRKNGVDIPYHKSHATQAFFVAKALK